MSRIPDVAHVIEIRSDTTTEYRVYTESREVSGVALSQVSIIRQGHFWWFDMEFPLSSYIILDEPLVEFMLICVGQ